jgi:hypothetical protein
MLLYKALNIFTTVIVITGFFTILLSAYIPGNHIFLWEMTREGGFFETTSFLVLLLISGYGAYFCIKHSKLLNKILLLCIGGFAFLAFVGAMEEISWGQHIFHFSSPDYFVLHNRQGEINLHNFISGTLFSTLIYVNIYILLVFMPLLCILLSSKIPYLAQLKPWVAQPSVILTVMFAQTFLAYFEDIFIVHLDTFALMVEMLLFGIGLVTKKIPVKYLSVYILVWLCILTFASTHQIFKFSNHQYEIREAFVAVAILYYFIFLTQKLLVNSLKKQ